jgi:hypothetical protein
MSCNTKAITLNLVTIGAPAIPAMALLAGVAVVGSGVALLANAVGREFAARLDERIEPERLARPGATLTRFETPIPIARLLHEAASVGLQAAGSIDLRGADGATARFISLRRGDAVVAALRVAGGTTEILTPMAEAVVVRDLAGRAIATALEETVGAAGYAVARVSLGSDNLRLAAQRIAEEEQRVSVRGAWEAGGMQLQLDLEGHEPSGHAHLPDVHAFLEALGFGHPGHEHDQPAPKPPLLPPAGGPAPLSAPLTQQRGGMR